MSKRGRAVAKIAASLLAWALLVCPDRAGAGIVLVGTAVIPGNAIDKSGLTETLRDGTPHNRLGSFGSAIAYTGTGNRYLLVADRGPGDGKTDFHCRWQEMDIAVSPGSAPAVRATLVGTTLLRDESGAPFVGALGAFDVADPSRTLRLDPEGIRVGRSGTVFVSDEYGPFVYEFSREGRRLRALPVPKKFLVAHPKADPSRELHANTSGRVPNRGFEGLAISPDGSRLYAALQSALLQDGGREGINLRILELNVRSGATREFVYGLDDANLGVTEILAINEHQFLVLERDHWAGAAAQFKAIIKMDIAGASDVSGVAALPKRHLPSGLVAVSKRPFLDLLAHRHGLRGPSFPENVEGLAFGPDLPDGRRLLLVTSDNDFLEKTPTYIYAFAIDPAELPDYRPQVFGR
jgi:hypothetical protein